MSYPFSNFFLDLTQIGHEFFFIKILLLPTLFSVFFCLSACLSVCLSVRVTVYVYMSVRRMSVWLSVYPASLCTVDIKIIPTAL